MDNSIFPYQLIFLVSCLFMNTANATNCDKKTIREYVSDIEYRSSTALCGADMGFILIQLKKPYNKKDQLLGRISLDIKNSNNINITQYPLNLSHAERDGKITACLNKSYLENSSITFSITLEERKYSKNMSSLKLSSKKQECNLKSIVNNT